MASLLPKFKSQFEKDVASFYKLTNYETESIKYTLTNNYTPDFKIKNNVYIECKGFFKPSDRRKILEVIKQYPNIKLIMFFQNSKVKLGKRSKTTYGDWCSKHGIEWFCWKSKKPTKRVFNLVTSSSSDKSLDL
jgi:predicted nuclease of restriction endonuclease-like RecB superfamily